MAWLGLIMDQFEGIIAVLPDHPTPCYLNQRPTITSRVPFVILGGKKRMTEDIDFQKRPRGTGKFGIKNAVDFLEFLFQE